MTVPNDIPGYCQGFRFSDAAEFYNGSNRFLDQSPFGNWDINDCELIAGTPTFDTVLGARALRVDNTSHWGFLPAHAWEGTVLMVAKPFYGGVGATITKYPLLAGTQGTLTSNAALVAQYASTARRFTFQGTGATVGLILTQANDDGRVFMFSSSQEARRFYGAQGPSVSSTAEYTANPDHGFQLAPSVSSPDLARRRMILGAMSGLAAGTAAQTDYYIHIFEMHFWKDPVLVTHEADCLSLIADLKTAYGI